MKRPSNLIIVFIGAIAGTFLIFAVGRMAVWFFSPPETEVEIEPDYESRQLNNSIIVLF